MIHISLSKLLVLLADLIPLIPGLATAIHRFSFAKLKTFLCPNTQQAVKKALSHMTRAITNEPFVLNTFMSFLVHILIVPEPFYPASTVPIPDESQNETTVRDIIGTSLRDSASYLLASLASKPGDGRRRALKELVDAYRIGNISISTSKSLNDVLVLTKMLEQLLSPPQNWRSVACINLTTRDTIQIFASLKIHYYLQKTACSISNEHPMTFELNLHLAATLEFILRKGLPLVSPNNLNPSTVSAAVASSQPSSQASSQASDFFMSPVSLMRVDSTTPGNEIAIESNTPAVPIPRSSSFNTGRMPESSDDDDYMDNDEGKKI
jgi:hypothetical protein